MDMEKMKRDESENMERVLFNVLNGEASPAELLFFKEWMEEEQNRQYFRQIKEVWNAVTDAGISEEEKKEAYRRFCKYMADSSPRNWRRRILVVVRYAAIIVVAMIVG